MRPSTPRRAPLRALSFAIALITAFAACTSEPASSTTSSAITAADCEKYGFASMRTHKSGEIDCRVGNTSGVIASVSLTFNCRLPTQHVWMHHFVWYQCTSGRPLPSNGRPVEWWSYGCREVNGLCRIIPLGEFDLGEVDESTPEGMVLRAAWTRIQQVRADVLAAGGNDLTARLMLVDGAEMFTAAALDAFRAQEPQEGITLLGLATTALDVATDFVPGVSTVKDLTIILTGVNPITGESVSDTERALTAGSLLVPAFLSGGAKGLTKLTARLDRVAEAGGAAAHYADDVADAVRRSDDALREVVPCLIPTRLTSSVVAQARPAPCDVAGAVTAAIAEEAEEALKFLREGKVGFGTAPRADYAKTFREHYGYLNDQVGQVHHAVEQQVLDRYPGIVTAAELNSLENLRGIPKGAAGTNLHQSLIRRKWDDFYQSFSALGRNPTKDELLQYAKRVDNWYGSQFLPAVR